MDTKPQEWIYIDAADVAKMVRQDLKKHFAGEKFSVRTDKYSGGASVTIHWTDGPTGKQVEAIAKKYEGSDFDGMIDLKVSNIHYQNPDGSIDFGGTAGTGGSGGSIPPQDCCPTYPEAKRVHLGADYIFCTRSVTNEESRLETIARRVWATYNTLADKPFSPTWRQERIGNEWMDTFCQRILTRIDFRVSDEQRINLWET